MPDINNPIAVRFCNEQARVLADAAEQLYETAKRFQAIYAAVSGATIIPNTADPVIDGASLPGGLPGDGRKQITGAMITALDAWATTVITHFEGGGPPTRIAQLRRISVNGGPRF